MKSKAHSKKCLEMGISGSPLDDPDEAGKTPLTPAASAGPVKTRGRSFRHSDIGNINRAR